MKTGGEGVAMLILKNRLHWNEFCLKFSVTGSGDMKRLKNVFVY